MLMTGLLLYCQENSNKYLEGYAAQENLRTYATPNTTSQVYTFDNRYEGVKGTPYVFTEWYPGEIFLKGKKKVKLNELNYNCFNSEIVFRETKDGPIMQINPYVVDFFILYTPDSVTFVPVNLPGEKEIRFVREIYKGESTAYLNYGKEFMKADYQGGYSADRRYDEFADKKQIYIRLKNESDLIKLKGSRKNIINIFGDQREKMGKFINNGKPDFKEVLYVKEMMEFYDSLN